MRNGRRTISVLLVAAMTAGLAACGRLLKQLMAHKLHHVLLGHLSRDNNYPELAYETVKYELTQEEGMVPGKDFVLKVACRNEPTPPILVQG